MEEPLGEAASPGVAAAAAAGPRKQQGVKRHHHKHNLKHRYELQETLGKGTYGKVKRAIERFSGRVVSEAGGGAAPGFRRLAFLAAPVGSEGLRAARFYAGAPLFGGWGGWVAGSSSMRLEMMLLEKEGGLLRLFDSDKRVSRG